MIIHEQRSLTLSHGHFLQKSFVAIFYYILPILYIFFKINIQNVFVIPVLFLFNTTRGKIISLSRFTTPEQTNPVVVVNGTCVLGACLSLQQISGTVRAMGSRIS